MKTAEKIQNIRDSEEAVRRRWFWGLSALFGIIAVGIWAAYMQSVLPKTKNATDTEPAKKTAETESAGFFSILGRGISEIGKQAETGWQNLGGRASGYFSDFQKLINTERSVDFQPENDLEFAPVPVEEIPAADLPATTQ